ncbi:MAG: VWA domain-containing protein [Gammaproteobacteria bacterium]|nr:VWA domain-containing protein [Gammaproteobacteria bacterium]
MRFRRRPFSIFTLSFLDVMCCGFGAVVLLFMILKHEAIVKEAVQEVDLTTEVELLRKEIESARANASGATAQSNTIQRELAELLAQSAAARAALAAAKSALQPRAAPAVTRRDVEALKAALLKLEAEKRKLLSEVNEKSQQVRSFAGEGNREYLTGIKMGGKRTLILLDASASMLDDTIVNVLRRRNMDDAAKRRSEKWQQAVDTVDWISTRMNPGSQYQIFLFNTEVRPVLPGTGARWLSTDDRAEFNQVVGAVKQLIPDGGSNLAKALQVLRTLQPQADNVFLVTDGLPTQGLSGGALRTVSGKQRIQFYEEARSQVPGGSPINVILLPMEGDPMAPWAFWDLAMMTRGSFLTPAYDWP